MTKLQLKQVQKAFGETKVIHGVDLVVDEGEFVVFVGPSGCGKSTLLRLVAGLEAATAGDIVLEGKRVNDVGAAERGCAMVFQSYALYPHMSVFDNMAFGLQNLGIARETIETKVREAAVMLRLNELLQRKPTQLSGGQRQRVAIGRAIVREPKLFLFDEPLSNLDAELRISMRSEIRDLHHRLQATMIYVTHDQVEAMTMADKIVVLRDGRVEQIGSPLSLYNQPANTFVAGFIGSPRMNFLPADLAAGAWTAPAGAQTVGIRPEHARLAADGALRVKVTQVEQMGGSSLLHGRLAGDQPFELLLAGQTEVQRGDSVGVALPAELLHAFDRDGRRI